MKFYQYVIFLLFSICGFHLTATEKKTIRICIDDNTWYPFTYTDSSKKIALGLHIDIAKKALEDIGYSATFEPRRWDACIGQTGEGKYDAIVSASYKPDRAKILYYPPDAANPENGVSDFRVTQVEYIFIVPASSHFTYTGDNTKLPEHILITKGYSIGDDLKKEGVKGIQFAPGDRYNIKKLLNIAVHHPDSVAMISLPDTFHFFLKQQPELKEKLRVETKPIKSKSYFMVFSKKSDVIKSSPEREEIWKSLRKTRENESFIHQVLKKY
ncbi:MAG: transporter substrate-binding domain-containing protein [Deltaproteobacteria bacterium]|nr:transporter substrate-binding domain-containing protein [Deltaproteobacteria bacterium]